MLKRTDPIDLPGPGLDQDPRPHAVVIGSGFGGLAAAVRLGARGYRVTVAEKLDAPGGRAYVFRQNGFVFDGGPTIITAPFLFEELWELAGKRLADDIELKPITPFYQIRFDDGTVFDYGGSREDMRREIGRISPGDVAGYDRFMKRSERLVEVGFTQLSHIPFTRFFDMLRISPDLIRLSGYRTVYGAVASFVKDERVRIALSFHPLLVGGNPFSTTAIYNLIGFLEQKWGVHFAMGGTGALVEGLVRLIEGQGGRMLYNAQVDEILVKDGRAAGVRLADGRTLAADIVVSNADPAHVYRHLLPGHVRKRWTDKALDARRYSMSLVVWYFGTDKQYTDVPHHMLVLGPRYKGLLDDIFTHKRLAEDCSLYLHRPTATDPSLAPPGGDAFYVLSPVPHLDSGTDWDVETERYRRLIEQRLEQTVLPDLSKHVVASHIITPRYFEQTLLSHKGAAFAMEPQLIQSAWFRPHNVSEEVRGLYLVGAGTHPGAGLPGVLSSAKVLDKVVPDVRTRA
ncbi:MAG: phytoene desaturase [Rhodothalassiaceae bacterium]